MNNAFIDVLKGRRAQRRPIWLMRQAGRYLEEYRQVRSRAGGFLDLCYTPKLACEVTLQPLRRFDLDAAILFADILLLPQAMGVSLDFRENEGPVLSKVGSAADVADLNDNQENVLAELGKVFEAVSLIRTTLDKDMALIGFCGAPWTVATYMIEGGTSVDRPNARVAAYADSGWLNDLVSKLTQSSVEYLAQQIEAGANAVQIFDTWAGDLSGRQLEQYCFEPFRKITSELKTRYPDVPIIGFARGLGPQQLRFAETTGVDCVGLEAAIPSWWAKDNLVDRTVVQGNLDPLAVVAGGEGMLNAARDILNIWPAERHVFNLGHGIRKETPPEHVSRLVDFVRSLDGLQA